MHLLTDRQIDFVWVFFWTKIEKKFKKNFRMKLLSILLAVCTASQWSVVRKPEGLKFGNGEIDASELLSLQNVITGQAPLQMVDTKGNAPFMPLFFKKSIWLISKLTLYFSARNVQRFFACWKGSYSHCASDARRPRTGWRGFGTVYRGITAYFCSFVAFFSWTIHPTQNQ